MPAAGQVGGMVQSGICKRYRRGGREVTCLSGSGLWAAACAPCGARRGCDIEGHADSAQSVRLGIEVNTVIAMIIIYNNYSEIRVS